jgi:hypothetical protein
MPSPTTYVYEAQSSVLLHLKSMKKKNFKVEDDLSLKISMTQPDITRPVSLQKQHSCWH